MVGGLGLGLGGGVGCEVVVKFFCGGDGWFLAAVGVRLNLSCLHSAVVVAAVEHRMFSCSFRFINFSSYLVLAYMV